MEQPQNEAGLAEQGQLAHLEDTRTTGRSNHTTCYAVSLITHANRHSAKFWDSAVQTVFNDNKIEHYVAFLASVLQGILR